MPKYLQIYPALVSARFATIIAATVATAVLFSVSGAHAQNDSQPALTQSPDAAWSAALSASVPSVVSLQVSYVRDYVESNQGVSSATGFVVDAERGIILTNRHVMGGGPVAINATFQNLERVDVVPLYRDPVHDFGFLRYNPADLKRNQPVSLKLNAAGATVGTDIRVIGSDGGEQLSILAGTIARTDRRAPNYGRYGHNDFNTFYLQAASSTSGGSSGSPVLNRLGEVIALNAAANSSTASSFFLPLDRIQYALEKLQAGEPVARGTVQTVFEQHPYRLLSRLGLSPEISAEVQREFPQGNGMLLVRQILPGGVAEGKLQEGDILLRINGEYVTHFIPLAETLDGSIGQTLEVTIVRRGQQQTVQLEVQDLQALQPDQLVELGDSILHDISVQRARGMNLPQRGVMVSRAGYEFSRAGVARGSLITEINGTPINNLDDLLAKLTSGKTDAEWRLRYVVPGREFTSSIATVDVNDKWFAARECGQRDDQRFWQCSDIDITEDDNQTQSLADAVLPNYDDPLIQQTAMSLVRLSFDIPYAVDNVYAKSFSGVGLIVDAERGLVVTDRNTVPVELGDLEMTFFSTYKVPAKVVFLHPLHNIALLQYDTELLGDIEIPVLPLADSFPSVDHALEQIGYRSDGTVRKQKVANLSEVTLYFDTPQLPRFQQVPVDVVSASLIGPTLGGPLLDESGTVQALWQSFAYQDGDDVKEGEWAMPAAVVNDIVQQYLSDKPLYLAPAAFEYRPLDVARERGLNNEWLAKLAATKAKHRRVIAVRQVVGGAESPLLVGDILLAVDGQISTTFRELERHFQKEAVVATVLRDGAVVEVDVTTLTYEEKGTGRALLWAGSLIQEPQFELAFQRGNVTDGLFISSTLQGSPSIQDRLYRNRFIVAVDGAPVTTIDEMINEIAGKDPDTAVNLTVVTMNGFRSVVSVKPEYNFWPTMELKRDGSGWQRTELASAGGTQVGSTE